MPWPTCEDLQAYLAEEVGVPLPVLTSEILETAIEELASLSGWKPFQSTRESVAFDPPGKAMLGGLRMGGESILEMPGRGILTLYSLTVSGQTRTQGTDFWLQNKVGAGYVLIRFLRPVWGAPQSVVIDADWGRECTAGPKARRAVLALAAGTMLQAQSEQYQGLGSYEEAGVSEKFDSTAIKESGLRLRQRGEMLAAELQHPGSWG